jgi:hypothetical protein
VLRTRSLKLYLTAGLAALLLLTQVGALAHSIKHGADKPDSSCAQCLFASHPSGPTTSPHLVSGVAAPEVRVLPASVAAPRRHAFCAYLVRAPPRNSEI